MPDPSPPELLSLRAAVIFAVALVVGSVGGLLTYLAQHNVAQAVLAGGAAFGASVGLLNGIVARK